MNKIRSSNFELYRVIFMFLIIAHHYVVNSGLTDADGPLLMNPFSANTTYLYLFGMWGKACINCYLMITGYFMCTKDITVRKFLKLILQVYFYRILFYLVFLLSGYEKVSCYGLLLTLFPLSGFNSNFVSCFIAFWLTIPFLNILIRNLSKRQHALLVSLLLFMYTIIGSLGIFSVVFNYVTWFCVVFLISSYFRLYPNKYMAKKKFLIVITMISILSAIGSALYLQFIKKSDPYFFVTDSNKIFAVAIGVSSFLLFTKVEIGINKCINFIGSSTFGVLLIHANSDTMRRWLWCDVVDCVGHYNLPFCSLIIYSLSSVLVIFISCVFIDKIRIFLFEKPLFNWLDRKYFSNQQG